MFGGRLVVIVLTLAFLAMPVHAEVDASTVAAPLVEEENNCLATDTSARSGTSVSATTVDGYGVRVSALGKSVGATAFTKNCVEAGQKSSRAAWELIEQQLPPEILDLLP